LTSMQSNYLPLWKTLETPFFSLDESHVEMFSLLALFLLTFFVMLAGKRRQIIRHVVQLVSVLIFFYIVFSCLGVFGLIRNTIVGFSRIGTVFTESFFWMSLPLVIVAFSLTTGPYFCGWICPTGTFQELVAILRKYLKKLFFPKKPFKHQVKLTGFNLILVGLFFIGFIMWVYWLGTVKHFFVEDASLYWAASLIFLTFLILSRSLDDRAIRALRAVSFAVIVISALLKTSIISPVHFAFADVRDPASALTTLVLVVASFFISCAWCRYICPWGYLMGCLHRVSRLQIKPTQECNQCGKCSNSCRVQAIRKGKVNVSECQFCLACVDSCPENALEVVDVWKKVHRE